MLLGAFKGVHGGWTIDNIRLLFHHPYIDSYYTSIEVSLVTAVLGVIGIALLVSYKQGAFVRYTAIHFYAADAFGISKGMAVRLLGL